MTLPAAAEKALGVLPPKRAAFVRAYCGEAKANGTLAAEMAGYSSPATEACRLLRDAKVSVAIETWRQVTQTDAVMTAQELAEWLTGVVAGVVTDTETTLSGDVVEKPPKMSDRLKAAQLLAKVRGYEAPQQHQVAAMVAAVPSVGTPEDWKREVRALRSGGDE